MADAVKIRVEIRDPAKNKGTGTKFSRKLRKSGRIPAIIYGHKQAPTPISLARDSVWEMIKKKTHLAELEMDGGASETVLVRDIQWDHLGKEIIHLDFARVSASDAVETEVPIELRGVAPGLAEGGILEQLVHDILVTCRADAIPNNIKVDISDLHLGKAIHVKELKLPEGVTTKLDPESLIVHVTTKVIEATTTEVAEGTQPEVIKPERKEKED
jgi:large subunit ribosomal protein L25